MGDNVIENGGVPEEVKKENMAAWLCGANTIIMKPFELAPLGPLDVRVRVKASGICGTDIHLYKNLRHGETVLEEPYVMGHECAGIVEEVGREVKHLEVGDRVSLEPAVPCRLCKRCTEGNYHHCPHIKCFGSPPSPGAFVQKIVHPADMCFKLPDNVSLEEGAICEPLGVTIHSCRRTGVGAETTVLIMGSGPIGLLQLLSARAFGAPRIVIADINQERLATAKKLGADECIHVSVNSEDIPAEVRRIQTAMGEEIDVTFDCVGFSKTMTTALRATRVGGKVALLGMGHHEMTVPLPPAACREVDVIGIHRYKNTWPLCLKLLSSGKLDVKPLITHRFGFSPEEVEEAFKTSARGGSAIKVMFVL